MLSVSQILEATGGRLLSGKKSLILSGLSIDSRAISKAEVFLAIKGERFDGHDFIEAVADKGVQCFIADIKKKIKIRKGLSYIAVKNPLKALADIAYFKRRVSNIPLIAVTGSNGKTTTKDMLAWVLEGKFPVLKNEGTKNNHIGLPLTLANLAPEQRLAVLEIGTNHFGEVNYLAKICQPNIGIITAIGPSHLEYFKTLKGVFKEKYTLIDMLKRPTIGILNADDRFLKIKLRLKSQKPFLLGFSRAGNSDFFASEIIGDESLQFVINGRYPCKLNSVGVHNISNALAVFAAARILGIEPEEITARLSSFIFPSGRLSLRQIHGVRFIDDTYNASPLSFLEALKTLDRIKGGRKILILGDMRELGSKSKAWHVNLGKEAAVICDTLIGVGAAASWSIEAARNAGFDTANLFTCENALEARGLLFNRIIPKDNDIVLVKGSRAMKMEEVFKT